MDKLTEQDIDFIIANYCAYHRQYGVKALSRRFKVSREVIEQVIREHQFD